MEQDDIYICGHTRKCKWKGSRSQLVDRPEPNSPILCWTQVCPRCGNDAFYVRNADGSKKKF